MMQQHKPAPRPGYVVSIRVPLYAEEGVVVHPIFGLYVDGCFGIGDVETAMLVMSCVAANLPPNPGRKGARNRGKSLNLIPLH
jgi:hypothetical protein